MVNSLLNILFRVGQNRIYTLYTTVRMVISLLHTPHVHRIFKIKFFPYKYIVLAHPIRSGLYTSTQTDRCRPIC